MLFTDTDSGFYSVIFHPQHRENRYITTCICFVGCFNHFVLASNEVDLVLLWRLGLVTNGD